MKGKVQNLRQILKYTSNLLKIYSSGSNKNKKLHIISITC